MNMSIRSWMRAPSRTLFMVQLLALLLYPFLDDNRAGQIFSTALSVGVLAAAVWMVHRSPRPGWIAGVLAIVGVMVAMLRNLPARLWEYAKRALIVTAVWEWVSISRGAPEAKKHAHDKAAG